MNKLNFISPPIVALLLLGIAFRHSTVHSLTWRSCPLLPAASPGWGRAGAIGLGGLAIPPGENYRSALRYAAAIGDPRRLSMDPQSDVSRSPDRAHRLRPLHGHLAILAGTGRIFLGHQSLPYPL